MGLPIFVEPTEPNVASKAAEKVASAPRSSIRRQRPAQRPPGRVSAEHRRRRLLSLAADGGADYEAWENDMRERRLSPDLGRPTGAPQGRASRMLDDDGMRLHDTVSFERQHPPRAVIDGPLMPPVPESRDYSGAEERRREIQRLHEVRRDLRRIARRIPAPAPPFPYTDNDIAVMARLRPESPRPASVSPARSPRLAVDNWFTRRPAEDSHPTPREVLPAELSSSRQINQETEAPTNHEISVADISPDMTLEALTGLNRQAGATLSDRISHLRRMTSHFARSRRFLRQQRGLMDGLGDRDRSLSPEGGATWDTLLTSIAPDPQPPSAGSSFASASAAAAAASSSANSGPAPTDPPMTSFGRVGSPPAIHDCDVSESGSVSGGEEEEEEDMYELRNFARPGDDIRAWTSMEVVNATPPERAAQRNSMEDTEHLGGMQRIISRLAERDDIPEEWWRMAGLRREPAS